MVPAAIPCCPSCPWVSVSLPLWAEVNLAISVACSRCKPKSLSLPQSASRTDPLLSWPENFFHGQMYLDTKTTRNTSCPALLGHACVMDFLVAPSNCEISSCSIEGSHTSLCSLLQPSFESKNSSWQVLWGKYKGQLLPPWMRAVRRREQSTFLPACFSQLLQVLSLLRRRQQCCEGSRSAFWCCPRRCGSSFSPCYPRWWEYPPEQARLWVKRRLWLGQ